MSHKNRNLEKKSTSQSITGFFKSFLEFEESKPLIALITLFAGSSIISPHFLTWYNQRILLLQMAPLAMLALGETAIILMGSIDLSPGSVMALSGTVAAIALIYWHMPVGVAAIIGMLTGAICGLINGLLITKAKIPSFVATLAILVAGRGMVLIITGGMPVVGLKPFTFLTSDIAFLPSMVWIAVLATILLYFLMKMTKIGREVYAIGGNEDAARYSGVNADLTKIIIFTMAGILYAISGLMMNARLEVAYPWTGWGYELDAIAAAVLGGVQLTGGVGSTLGSVMGAYILTLITNILILLGVNPYYQWVVKGAILAIAATVLTRGLRYVK